MFEDFDILSSVKIIWLNWIGHGKRMVNKRKVNQLIKNNPH
jgi:hypothetical protein